MKKFYILTLMAVLGSMSFHSCKKEPLMTFRAENSVYFKSNTEYIYIGVRNEKGIYIMDTYNYSAIDTLPMDTMYANFKYYNDTSSVIRMNLEVNAMGDTSSQDRTFAIEVDPSSTLSSDLFYIDPATCKIPHGRLSVSVPLYFKRNASLVKEYKFLTFNLKANENFFINYKGEFSTNYKTKYKSVLSRTYAIADKIPRPTWWGVSPTSIGTSCFAAFSIAKVQFLMRELQIPFTMFLSNSPDVSLILGLAQKYNCFLAERRKAGHPVMDIDDETGKEFEMKSSSSGGSLCD
ncbi:DUF4843 domain-containing protein [Chitinophaga silvatica]|uniref:DUF4843 domain-containing protein n=1 Tax=Chitinophaga silvatica TaxID=2282649 RepID=A0A3E1Y4A4_9BACT|nr:DUF4843 domain-containing protein [Chitinophaga silvatica]RFS19317.1 DUF4843 domain-containing protein [Chitinophaga silvatica]